MFFNHVYFAWLKFKHYLKKISVLLKLEISFELNLSAIWLVAEMLIGKTWQDIKVILE